ncbi:MAG: hypothetical protein GYA58_03440 [Anaerolineaceae bacterium]|nr:hypothetical protein [Anaerolineaceae bacterium]
MIGKLPLWVVLLIWLLQRHNRSRFDFADFPRMRQLLDEVYRSLPLPGGWLETWLVTRVANWINEERDALIVLERLGVITTGQVPARNTKGI